MEPTAGQREDYLKILSFVNKEIPSFVGNARTFRDQGLPIDNISDFALGMVYHDYFEKVIKYNVKYVQEHPETTNDRDLADLGDIAIDVFKTDANTTKELIQKELSKNL